MFSLLPLHDSSQIDPIVAALNAQFIQMAQEDRPAKSRTQTARSYASALRALSEYMQGKGIALPTRAILDQWREDMLQGRLTTDKGKVLAVNSVNVRLAAARALLRGAAHRLAALEQRLLLREWAEVADAKAIFRQDLLDEDYGVRLSQPELEAYIGQIRTSTIKGLRDRALIMVLSGAGLRISEAVRLTIADVFLTAHPSGLFGIRVRHGKHRKSRIVVLGPQSHPIFQALRAYVHALGIPIPEPLWPDDEFDSLADMESDWAAIGQNDPVISEDTDVPVFRSLRRGPNREPISTNRRLSPRSVERIVAAYPARHRKKRVRLAPHDLRRTYAKLCKEAGMSWEALREQMGHTSVNITERYVGHEVDWTQRLPGWSFKWEADGR
jgi:site-specific recombinase XerD